jgi:hypothetical protein
MWLGVVNMLAHPTPPSTTTLPPLLFHHHSFTTTLPPPLYHHHSTTTTLPPLQEDAPMYFKQALTDADEEWSQVRRHASCETNAQTFEPKKEKDNTAIVPSSNTTTASFNKPHPTTNLYFTPTHTLRINISTRRLSS